MRTVTATLDREVIRVPLMRSDGDQVVVVGPDHERHRSSWVAYMPSRVQCQVLPMRADADRRTLHFLPESLRFAKREIDQVELRVDGLRASAHDDYRPWVTRKAAHRWQEVGGGQTLETSVECPPLKPGGHLLVFVTTRYRRGRSRSRQPIHRQQIEWRPVLVARYGVATLVKTELKLPE